MDSNISLLVGLFMNPVLQFIVQCIVSTLFQVLGVLLIAAGSWALSQKDSNVSLLGGMFISPVVLLLLAGCIIFAIGFFGCIGALRENTWLLGIVSTNIRFDRLIYVFIRLPRMAVPSTLIFYYCFFYPAARSLTFLNFSTYRR